MNRCPDLVVCLKRDLQCLRPEASLVLIYRPNVAGMKGRVDLAQPVNRTPDLCRLCHRMDKIEENNSYAAEDVSKIIIADVRSDVVKVIDTDGTFSSSPNLENIRQIQSNFAKERNWEQYHQPQNLLLALVGEVGELAELFQWRGEVKEGLPDWTEEDKEHLSQELSDVLLYLIRLSEKCHIDLPAAVLKKISMNAEKYPASKEWGSDKICIKNEDSS
ncbi:dCTP pyrophosphatase 1 [Trichonephila clavipes]|nr:dCTP pyrophosphatase 1 [Trichonephila clavipes]